MKKGKIFKLIGIGIILLSINPITTFRDSNFQFAYPFMIVIAALGILIVCCGEIIEGIYSSKK
jgi:hypothetical protein